MRKRPLLAAFLVAAVAGTAGCGGSDESGSGASAPPPTAATTAPAQTAPAHPADAPPTAREQAERRERRARPPAPTCPPGAANCEAAAGRVIGLESKDADGDGDLHLLIASRTSITLPGITVLDVNKDLRPAQDPRIGDWAAGAGPVYEGSYGQRQIQVEQVAYAPRRG